ncbi:MAG: hypothetical protein ACOCW3_05430 [Spirochaetota bacterium]
MKNRFLLGLIVVMVVTALTGCEWLLAPRVDKVNPEDLTSYSAGTTFASDEDSVLQAMGTTGAGAGEGTGYVIGGAVEPQLGFAVEGNTFEAVFNGLVQHSIDAARSIAPSRAVTEIDNSDFSDPSDFEIDYTLDISNESVSGAEVFGADGGGTAAIETFFLEVTGSGSESGSSAEIDARGEQDGVFTYDDWTDGVNFIIHDGLVNSEGSGRISIEVNETSTDIAGNLFWRFGYAVNAGFSVSDLNGTPADTSDDEGGKIIVSFRYWGRENIDFDSAEELENQAQGEFEAEMTIQVYDNNNNLVAEHEFTDEDAYETGW